MQLSVFVVAVAAVLSRGGLCAPVRLMQGGGVAAAAAYAGAAVAAAAVYAAADYGNGDDHGDGGDVVMNGGVGGRTHCDRFHHCVCCDHCAQCYCHWRVVWRCWSEGVRVHLVACVCLAHHVTQLVLSLLACVLLSVHLEVLWLLDGGGGVVCGVLSAGLGRPRPTDLLPA